MENRMTNRQKKFLLKLISLYINKKWEGWKDFKGNLYKNINYTKSEYGDFIYDCRANINCCNCESINIKMKEFSKDYFYEHNDKFYYFDTTEIANYDGKKKKWYLSKKESKFYKKIIKRKISKSSASRLIFWLKKDLNFFKK